MSARQAGSARAGQTSREISGLAAESAVVLPSEGSLDARPFFSSRRHPTIEYADRESTDVVGELAKKIEEGAVRLRFEGRGGYLLSVLEELNVPVESQSVVFSKTSLQSHWIGPSNPRAIFYSDHVSVAFIRNAPLLELTAIDPQLGAVFYALDQREAERPRIVRSDSCLSCHESRNTMDVPGMLARSMGVAEGGQTMPQSGNYVSDHRSAFEERWGGWFVTGRTGAARHMGRAVSSLEGEIDLEGYPSGYSDVSALLVLNHQVRMTNILTRVGWETRVAIDRREKHPEDAAAAERLIAADARELVDYMLFVDEAPFPGKFESTSGFPAKFSASGPQDSRGRSLRQLDLETRLLRYPCSYMIYSRAFDGLPAAAKDAVYARLWAVLSGGDSAPKYARLSPEDRTAIANILLETKPDLPSYFRRLE